MTEINVLGLKFTLGKDNGRLISEKDIEAKVNDGIEAFRKSFTYDKLFTTGQMLDVINGTRVTKPYETISTVYKAVKAICDNVPQADLELHAIGKQTDVEDPRLMELINNPNPKQSEQEFRQEWSGNYALHGEAFIRLVKSFGQQAGTTNLPAQLWNLDPRHMSPNIDKASGEIISWQYASDDGKITYQVSEILHTKEYNPYNKYRGLSPLQPIMAELQIDQASLQFNLSFFKNDGTPGYILSTDQKLTQEQRNRITEDHKKNHQGARNAHKMEVYESGLKPVTNVGSSHKDMEFQAQQEFMIKKILGTWRVPECLFNMTKDINYATLQGQMRIFWIYTLIPMMNKYKYTLNRGIVLPYNSRIEISLDLLSVPAFQDELYTKVTAAKDFWAMGFTAQEINEKLELGFNDVNAPWRHEAWVAWNMQTAKNALENPRIAEVVNDGGSQPGDSTSAPAPKSKALDPQKKLRNNLIIKNFERRASSVEMKIKSKMSKYFMDLRVEALKTPVEKLEQGVVGIDWHKANEKLVKILKPLIHEGVQHGLAMGKDHAGEGKGIQDDANQQTFNSYVSAQANNVTAINDTIKDQLATVLTQTAKEGASQSLQRDALAEILKDSMRGVFNSAVTRANLIARTETASAVNGGSWMYYKAIGVPKKSWVTSHDSHVRESHLASEDMGSIDINAPFIDGLMYPGDQNGDGSDICNCRCSLSPEVN